MASGSGSLVGERISPHSPLWLGFQFFSFPIGLGRMGSSIKQAVLVINVTHLQGKEAALLWDSSQSD